MSTPIDNLYGEGYKGLAAACIATHTEDLITAYRTLHRQEQLIKQYPYNKHLKRAYDATKAEVADIEEFLTTGFCETMLGDATNALLRLAKQEALENDSERVFGAD